MPERPPIFSFDFVDGILEPRSLSVLSAIKGCFADMRTIAFRVRSASTRNRQV